MNQAVKFQLGLVTIIIVYYLVRLLGISNINFNLWQQIYWGNFIKNSFLLFFTFLLFYQIFNQVRKMPVTGPTIIKGRVLKKILIFVFALGWLAVVTHTIFDSLKILLPLELLPLYQFADLMDETIAHIFIYMPIQLGFIILTLLEVQRPSFSRLTNLDLLILISSSSLTGILWGLNLTEGNYSLFTSLPVVVIYLFFAVFLTTKYKLKLRHQPWAIFSLITSSSVILSFSAWCWIFSNSTQLFTILK
jgi:hypothetical protein